LAIDIKERFHFITSEENLMSRKPIWFVFWCASVGILCVSTAAAAAVIDDTNDVWHWGQKGTTWAWSGYIGDKPNIDITQLTDTVSGEKITLTLSVAGSIENSEHIVYWLYYNTTDASYWITWTNGFGMGSASKFNQTSPVGSIESPDEVNATGNTITAIFEVLGNATPQTLWGWAAEYTTLGNQSDEWWGDWAPNRQTPSFVSSREFNSSGIPPGVNNTNGTTSEKKTPGFEVLSVLVAVVLAAVILRKRR
jgi:hypothetical protein